MDPQLIQDLGPLWDQLKQLGVIAQDASWGTALGMLAGLGALLTAAINIYRRPLFQGFAAKVVGMLPQVPQLKYLLWENLPLGVRVAIPALASLLVAVPASMAGAVSLPVALGGALVTTLASIFGHHAREKAGAVAAPVTVKLPPALQKVASVLLPMPKEFQAPVIKDGEP